MAKLPLAVFCYRSGEIGFSHIAPKGALVLGRGPAAHVRKAAEVVARHGYDGRTLLVPGIPEARTDEVALEAASWFRKQIKRRLASYAVEAPHV
ncbi:host nuclease inhibitor protein [Azospirillum agricola]|uniref:host nuclease inhibitor protein n=1 Tax=Azospirillum agricola TaxID=1720247 RepID=UPI000A0F3835|nr:host nuclease inhibitor protein [Azospirillum agricola]SMH62867.1 hypothetical protein SAMN02982994_6690 [Azospirillum lipoferum]